LIDLSKKFESRKRSEERKEKKADCKGREYIAR